jgi:hypothetical protein
LLNCKVTAQLWWFQYSIISRPCEFLANYLAAWREQAAALYKNPDDCPSITLFLGEHSILVPPPYANGCFSKITDEVLLQDLRKFYDLLRLKRGLSELIIPKVLRRVDYVKVSINASIL